MKKNQSIAMRIKELKKAQGCDVLKKKNKDENRVAKVPN